MRFLAPARIARYRSFLKLTTDQEVYCAYTWNYAISAMVFPIVGCVEMHLRDAIHRAMSRQYANSPDCHDYPWYDNKQDRHYPFTGEAKVSIEKVLCDVKTKRRKQIQPSGDDVVAAMTFGFWTNFFRTLSPVDAPRVIPRIFPHHPIRNQNQWGNSQKRHQLSTQLQTANAFRNRIAHHEPLFKFRHNNTYPKSLAQGLNNLHQRLDHCLTISAWINSDAKVALLGSDWFEHFQLLATENEFYNWVKGKDSQMPHYFSQPSLAISEPLSFF